MMSYRRILICVVVLCTGTSGLQAQATSPVSRQAMTTTVRGRVEVIGAPATSKMRHGKIPETVVWLTPMAGSEVDPSNANSANANAATGNSSSVTGANVNPAAAGSAPSRAGNPQLVQKNKSFEPHILVVPAGSMVEFPNRDPFFHNVFSLFEGKRFDLGLYEAGTSRMVRFDRPGISYIFCNIHPEMSAVVITVATPMWAVSNGDGQVSLAGIPFGRYLLHVWSEGMDSENAQPLTREITIAENVASLGVLRVPDATGQHVAHKNKYGREYDDPTPNSSVYEQQR